METRWYISRADLLACSRRGPDGRHRVDAFERLARRLGLALPRLPQPRWQNREVSVETLRRYVVAMKTAMPLPRLPYTMRKALTLALVFITAIAVSSSCSRSYYHDAEVLSAYQRQARAMCVAADAKSKMSTCRRAKTCASAAQAGLEAVQVYQLASAAMTATADDRIAADAAYAGAVATCGVAGVVLRGVAECDFNPATKQCRNTDGGTHD